MKNTNLSLFIILLSSAMAFGKSDEKVSVLREDQNFLQLVQTNEASYPTLEQRLTMQKLRGEEKEAAIRTLMEKIIPNSAEITAKVVKLHYDKWEAGERMLQEFESLKAEEQNLMITDAQLSQKLKQFRTKISEERRRQSKAYDRALNELQIDKNPHLDFAITQLQVVQDDWGLLSQTEKSYEILAKLKHLGDVAPTDDELSTVENCRKFESKQNEVALPFIKTAMQKSGFTNEQSITEVLTFYTEQQEAGVSLLSKWKNTEKSVTSKKVSFDIFSTQMRNIHFLCEVERLRRKTAFAILAEKLDLPHNPRLDYLLMILEITGDERSLANTTENLSDDVLRTQQYAKILDVQ